MLEPGIQVRPNGIDLNSKLLELKGDLDEETAAVTLAKFLYHNPTFTIELLTGIKLFPYQDIMLKSWLKSNFNLAVWARGGSKSSLAAIFALYYILFNPGKRVTILAQNFRSSRRIFTEMQKLVYSKKNFLLSSCFPDKPVHLPDCWSWKMNDGDVSAYPLAGGDRLRGIRSDLLIIDEFLLIPQEIYENVIRPFLVVKTDITEQQKIREIENQLIEQGKITEKQRMDFDSKKKILALSSASFQFQYLYKVYKDWINKIQTNNDAEHFYFVSRLSYEILPEELIEDSIVEEAKSGGEDNPSFKREFRAIFTDDSDSYFSAKKMNDCTVQDGHLPTIEIVGQKDTEYIWSVDTSYSSSKASDDFAQNLIKLDPKTGQGVLVHNYAVAGGDLRDHIEYAHYLLTNFNIVFSIMDKAGAEPFIQACNQNAKFIESGINLKTLDLDFDDETVYQENLRKAKLLYNKADKRFIYLQFFSPNAIREMNERLQSYIDTKKIWFASHPSSHKDEYERLSKIEIPEKMLRTFFRNLNAIKAVGSRRKNFLDINAEMDSYDALKLYFIDQQGAYIDLTKKECALIEPSISPGTGGMSFDLPTYLRKSRAADKARKDSYSCLLLGCKGMRIYYDLITNKDNIQTTFKPFFV